VHRQLDDGRSSAKDLASPRCPLRSVGGTIGFEQHVGDDMNYTDPNDFMAIGAALAATLLCGLILLV
jgi:hypothetical protein